MDINTAQFLATSQHFTTSKKTCEHRTATGVFPSANNLLPDHEFTSKGEHGHSILSDASDSGFFCLTADPQVRATRELGVDPQVRLMIFLH